jgi:hypothetical protein
MVNYYIFIWCWRLPVNRISIFYIRTYTLIPSILLAKHAFLLQTVVYIYMGMSSFLEIKSFPLLPKRE